MNTAQRQTVFWIVGFAVFFLALWLIGSVLLPAAAAIGVLMRYALARYLAYPLYDPVHGAIEPEGK